MRALCPLLLAAASLLTQPAHAADDYVLGPDSKPKDGVPKGEITKYTFENSTLYPGTWREYWVYVPKQYDPAKPACVFVCQDGIQYQAPTVFDNLIHQGQMPVTIGVFIMHGRVRALSTNALDRFNRSREYDGLGDTYARFVLDEILPDVQRKTTGDGRPIRLSTNGTDRCIAGASSGAIAAFTAAWERPDAFQRVFSSIGTYVDQQGGNDYPSLIRKHEPKPIRIFLQDGSNDNNGVGGSWWLANQEMLSALEFSGYDVHHVWGDGGHNGKHASAIFPDAMRWIWRDWPTPIRPNPENKSRQPVTRLLGPDSRWELVSQGHRFTEGPAINRAGELLFTDIPNNRIHRVATDGAVTLFAENTGGANGLKFGPDGRLYACANARKQIVAYPPAGGEPAIIADGLESNDLAITHQGDVYSTDPGNQQVWLIPKTGEKRVVDKGIRFPNGICFSPDQSLLYVNDTQGQFVFSFQIQSDGSLAHKQRFHRLTMLDATTQTGADGMAVDTTGTLYVTTNAGLQFCDQAGRVIGIISKPHTGWLSNVAFGGPNLSTLYVTCGDKVFKRSAAVRGLHTWDPPIKPAAPRL